MPGASIDTTGLAIFAKSVRRAVSGALQKELVTHLHEAGPDIVADMHAAAPGGVKARKLRRLAVNTVDAANTAAGIDISGGRGGSLGAVVFDGAEYGGRKSKKVFYSTRSRSGNAYVVHRRTTMQFANHLGTQGYFFWPTIRDWIPKLAKEQEEILEKALGGR